MGEFAFLLDTLLVEGSMLAEKGQIALAAVAIE